MALSAFEKSFSLQTDGVHAADRLHAGSDEPNTLSEAVKILKGVLERSLCCSEFL